MRDNLLQPSKTKFNSNKKITLNNLFKKKSSIFNEGIPMKIHYDIILNNLMKYLKKTLTEKDYINIKNFVIKEINNSINNIQSSSLSSIFNEDKIIPKEINVIMTPNNINYSNSNSIHKTECNLKNSIDLSTLISNQKWNQTEKSTNEKAIKVNSNGNENENIINSNTNRDKKTYIGKDVHSLYSIIKGSHVNQKKIQQNTYKTQVPSNSKSTSREKSNLTNYLSENKQGSNTNKVPHNQSLNNKVHNFLNEKLLSKLRNMTNIHNLSNSNGNNIQKAKNDLAQRKLKTKKNQINIHKIITKKGNYTLKTNRLENKLRMQNYLIETKLGNKTVGNSKSSKNEKKYVYSHSSNRGKNISNVNIQIDKRILSQGNSLEKSNLNQKKKKISNIQDKYNEVNEDSKCIEKDQKDVIIQKISNFNINNIKNIMKNEEMIKEIKNTLDDNLKVMFNFSYENFLSKESESESKKSSQPENNITDESFH